MSNNDTYYDYGNHEFLWLLQLKCIQGLGNEVYFKNMTFHISKPMTHVVSEQAHLRTCKLRNQLVIGELGASCTTFLFKTMWWLALWFWSTVIGCGLKYYFKILYYFIPRTRIFVFQISKTNHQDKYRHYLSGYGARGVCELRLPLNVKCIGDFDLVSHVRFLWVTVNSVVLDLRQEWKFSEILKEDKSFV